MKLLAFTLAAWICGITGPKAMASQVHIARGVYVPFFRDAGEKDRPVGPLLVDRFPVTNREFRDFVRAHPEWARSRIKTLFAGHGYLEHWTGDDTFPPEASEEPVTSVSWFAARKYCESHGERLLSIAEWEYVSDSENPVNLERILDWYGRPQTLIPVSSAPRNAFGLAGMHGLIWEWVEDFSSAIVAGDSRSTNETSRSFFCGSGSLKAKDPSQYATFMRFAYRSSLRADSVGRALGFRCARSIPDKTNPTE